MEREIPEILERIAQCESGGKQFHENGEVVRGVVNPRDVGLFQINLDYWGDEAKELGYDIFTKEGNIDMALHIYEVAGTEPWNWSKEGCWGVDN